MGDIIVLGAVVMPHNLFLHSEVIQSRQWNKENDEVIKKQFQVLNLKKYQMNKQIESILLMLEPQWSAKSINLDVSLEETIICGDEDLLSQVFINLIHNAIKFTSENGNTTVKLWSNEKGVQCKISDTGIGISEQDQKRIFERFYKADKSRHCSLGGNGLGLSIVKKIIDLHGGKISLTSEIIKGTEFTVLLPK